jgi:apolipoprotein N-acyltransferase
MEKTTTTSSSNSHPPLAYPSSITPAAVFKILDGLALITGLVLVTAFAPFDFHSASLLCPAALLLLWLQTTPRRAALRGFLFGLGFFGFGASWILVSIHRYGDLSLPLACLVTALFVITLSLFPMLTGYCFMRFFKHDTPFKRLAIFPCLWVIQESLRASIFTGFPWLLLGYSQIDLPLSGYIPIVGVYGTSFLICFSAAIITFAVSPRAPLKLFILLFLIWLAGAALSSVSWTHPLKNNAALSVALIQGDIAQDNKWQPEQIKNTLSRYTDLTTKNWGHDLIVWPESAMPLPFPNSEPLLETLSEDAIKNQANLIIGLPVRNEKDHRYYNGLIGLGLAQGYYYKRHLVPLGEYLPKLPFLDKLIESLDIPMSNFISGDLKQPLIKISSNIQVASFICYEIAYASLVLQDFPAANIMVTLTDDSWFGDSIAAAQHLQIAQARSLEVGRYQLFVSNTGPSAIISSKGKLLAIAPRDLPFSLTGNISALSKQTPFVHFGFLPLQIFLGILLLLAFFSSHFVSKFKLNSAVKP